MKPQHLNKALITAFFLAFIFPHFVIQGENGLVVGKGYGIVFFPPEGAFSNKATLDVPALLLTWCAIAVASIIVNRRELLGLITLLHRDRIAFEQTKLNKQIDLELQKQRILADAIVRHAEVMNESKQKNLF